MILRVYLLNVVALMTFNRYISLGRRERARGSIGFEFARVGDKSGKYRF
jgi:hypothetical protein